MPRVHVACFSHSASSVIVDDSITDLLQQHPLRPPNGNRCARCNLMGDGHCLRIVALCGGRNSQSPDTGKKATAAFLLQANKHLLPTRVKIPTTQELTFSKTSSGVAHAWFTKPAAAASSPEIIRPVENIGKRKHHRHSRWPWNC